MIKNAYWFSCKVLVILVRFEWKLNFLDKFSKNNVISNCLKARPTGAELFRADRQTDMTKLIVAHNNFANAPKNVKLNNIHYLNDNSTRRANKYGYD